MADELMRSMQARFDFYDKDGDGRLSAEEVLQVLGDEDDGVDPEEISAVVESLGSVSWEEFAELCEELAGFGGEEEEDEQEEEEPEHEHAHEEEVEAEVASASAAADHAGTPPHPPQRSVTPPRIPRDVAPGGADAAGEPRLQHPPPLPGRGAQPAAADVAPLPEAVPRARARARPQPASQERQPPPPAARPNRLRADTAVLDMQQQIAEDAGYHAGVASAKKKRKQRKGGCCAGKPQKSKRDRSVPPVPGAAAAQRGSRAELHLAPATHEPEPEPDSLQPTSSKVEGWRPPAHASDEAG